MTLTKHNIVKECTSSIVIYIQDAFVQNWRQVLEKHLKVHREEKSKVILKTGLITITLYEKPKKDPRSKLHIQSGDQKRNFEFVFDSLSMFYREVCVFTSESNIEDKTDKIEKSEKNTKLIVSLEDKKNYVCHYRLLQKYVELGTEVIFQLILFLIKEFLI